MNIQTELKRIGSDLSKATDVREIELNPTLAPSTTDKLLRDIVDHSKRLARSQSVTIVSFGRRR